MYTKINLANANFQKHNAIKTRSSDGCAKNSSNQINKLEKQLEMLGMNNKQLSFCANLKDPYSMENFDIARRKAGLNTNADFEKEAIPKNLLGKGAHSEVYKFSHPALDKWVLKVENNNSMPLYTKGDEFEGLNFGQEIARTSVNYSILKKQEGKPHSIENWSDRAILNNFEATDEEAHKFLQDLKKIAAFPQETFDDYAKNLKILTDNGYKMDSINPNNILIDYDNKKINIIDFYRPTDKTITNCSMDLISSILDMSFYNSYSDRLKSDFDDYEEFLNASIAIVDKCSQAAIKNKIFVGDKPYLDFLCWVDKVFNMSDKPDSHVNRYRNIELFKMLFGWQKSC